MSKNVLAVMLVALAGVALLGQAPAPAPPPALARVPSPPQEQPDRQMPPITFRSEVNYVEVDVVVQDAQGQFVRDLRREDFQVLENRTPQTVANFSLVDIPVTREERALFSPAAIEPDVRSNVGGPEGRVYVLVLDDFHTSSMRSLQVRRAARQFIERNIGANDLAAVVHTSGRQDAGQEFTNNRRLLAEAADKFMGKKLRSATLEKIDQYYSRAGTPMAGDPLKDPLEFERAYNARAVLETIQNIGKLLSGVSGRRKALVFFSEGIDYDIMDFMNNHDATTILDATREAIAAATRANVNVYSVDPRGLTTFGEDSMELSPPSDVDPALNLSMTGLLNEGRLSQDSLRVLSEETGGFAALNSNDFSGAFQRIVDENSSYYVMGYYPTNEKRDGSFRRIDVRVSRPGLTVRARRGYVATRGKAPGKSLAAKTGTSPELADALNSPIQVGGLPISVFVAPLRGSERNVAVAVVTQVSGLRNTTFTQKDGKYLNRLEVSMAAVDPQGKIRGGTRENVDLSLRPDTYERVLQFGFRVQSRFELPPGRYQLRVAVREGGGKIGSVHYDAVIPDFKAQPITMSGLVLASALGAIVPSAGSIPELKDMLPVSPSAARVFSARDQLALVAEVYDNQPTQPHSVEITTTLRSDEGRVVFSTSEKRSSADLGGKAGGYGYTAAIPLKDAAPGLYVLKVEAKSTLAGGGASREVQIRVVE